MHIVKHIILVAIFVLTCLHSTLAKDVAIAKADDTDYLDCAALLTAHMALLQKLKYDDQKVLVDLGERVKFFIKTAQLYRGSEILTKEMQEYYVSANRKHSSKVYQMMFVEKNSEKYLQYFTERNDACQDMINVNFKLLLERQGMDLN